MLDHHANPRGRFRRALAGRRALVALAVVLSLGVVLGWRTLDRRAREQQQVQLEGESLRLEAMLSERMRANTELLRASAALFSASDEVSRDDFHRFVASLELDQVHPGVQGIGFSRFIARGQLEAHAAAVRDEGYSNYVVWPEGARDAYASVVFLEPFSGRNLRAFGYDMFSEPARCAAMEKARDIGSASLTRPVRLVQETATDVQVGLVAYHPVYRTGALLQTVEHRRAALVGWTFIPYRLRDLVESIFGGSLVDVRLELFHGATPDPSLLLYDSEARRPLLAEVPVSVTQVAGIEDQQWTLRFSALPGYGERRNLSPPASARFGLVLIALLIFGIAAIWLGTTARASALATQLTASLRESEDRYRSVVDNLDVVVFQTDRDGRWTFLNTAFTTMTGRPVASSIGRLAEEFVHSEDRPKLRRLLQDLLWSARDAFEEEVHLADADERPTRCVSFYARATVTSIGVVGLSGTLTDISEHKQAEAATNAAREAAEAASRSKSLFLATMSHEIRTPMNGVLGMAEVLLGTDLDDEQRTATKTIIGSADALLIVINDILDYSKVESGRLQLERVGVQVRTVLGDVVRLLKSQADSRQLGLELRVSDEVPQWILGDAVRLRQVLINLVGNALKFTAAGSVTVEANRGPALDGIPVLSIAVKDTGIGMAPDAVARLFTPFEQADASISRRFGGTGLGLTISRQLVEMMGGRIAVKTAPGEGSTFTVQLPYEVTEPRVGTTPLPGVALAPSQRALIVDDNHTNLLVLERLLTRLGISSSAAQDGAEALERLKTESFDVVLMDLQMPVMDGDEATRRIRAGELGSDLQHVPIIALTADAMESTRARCLRAGMNDFLAKPVHLADLHRCLGRWLRLAASAA